MPTGLTQDAGWEIGVSRTLPRTASAVWEFIAGDEGVALWLGSASPLPTEKGAPYRTAGGVEGEIRSYHPGNRIRLTHGSTTVQVTVSPSPEDRAVLRFHEERLGSAEEREERRAHWQHVMDRVAAALD
ncbi:SRPBCC domain-containing protein [Streptomyces sp. NPDC060022]|uniref:SRPBCC domain-containing protein n=1 Tax=Streptomyces sp. NPDC060022 TaxID=3347039 RepID=UPI0036CADB62